MSEQSIIYIVKIGVDNLDDVVWKVGKASDKTLTNRVWSARRAVLADGNINHSFMSITVNGSGSFHERVMQTAFAKAFAPIKSPQSVVTEYYTPYVKYNRGVRKCEYTNERIEHALNLLQYVHIGSASVLGRYLSSVIVPSTVILGIGDEYKPAYCTRNKNSIAVDLDANTIRQVQQDFLKSQ